MTLFTNIDIKYYYIYHYQEFLEYLHKQQEDQAKDSMFAHSKKQREMLKAKEFSKKDSLANV